ncbi:hypothetical protein JB92DRAFT_1013063 [Gautieria morchelliformis]|nr:hypothetical protein JB92DRAFT_1013063 [Gautieria morchelliformis]
MASVSDVISTILADDDDAGPLQTITRMFCPTCQVTTEHLAYPFHTVYLNSDLAQQPHDRHASLLQGFIRDFLQQHCYTREPFPHARPRCTGIVQMSTIFRHTPFITFEVAPDATPAPTPDRNITIPSTVGPAIYRLRSIIYSGRMHFVVRLRDDHDVTWRYDGQENRGVPYHSVDETYEDVDPLLLRSSHGTMAAHIYIYAAA